jgi:vitamin B12 transporter
LKTLVSLLLLSPFILAAQPEVDYQFDPVVVVANRYGQPLSKLNRSVTILDADDIHALGALSVSDILSYVGSVDLQRRGQFGIQAEAGLRGASYEATLILIDGIKVNDPQTAHHNMDIPVNVDNIERIEILHGSGSALYGADAGGGIINIVTAESLPGISARIEGGQFGLMSGAVTAGKSLANWHNSVSASAQQSDGFTDYSDFKTLNLNYQSHIQLQQQKLNLYSGWINKKFGANSFYSNFFPNEREHTTTFFSKLEMNGGTDQLHWSPRISFRRHDDDFILDNARPNWYRNKHTSRTLGFELPLSWSSQFGQSFLTLEANRHLLKSASLGDHERTFGGLAFSQNITWQHWNFTTEGYAHYFASWGWKLWPALNLGYQVGKNRLFVFAGKSFRMPSFTELYYASPANMGNPNLTYSETISFELGHGLNWKNGSSRIALFKRHGENQIDWSRLTDASPWQVRNVASTRFTGTDGDLRLYPNGLLNVRSLFLSGIYMWGEKLQGVYQYKYALNYLRYSLSAAVENVWFGGVSSVVAAQWKKRVNTQPYFLLDVSLYKSIDRYRFYIKALNLFNAEYFEIPDVPLPGRWITAGVNINI